MVSSAGNLRLVQWNRLRLIGTRGLRTARLLSEVSDIGSGPVPSRTGGLAIVSVAFEIASDGTGECPMTTTTTPNESLTLAKALAVKNRLAGRLAQAQANIASYNSVLAGQREAAGGTVDVRAELERLLALQEGMVAVKAAIHRGNTPVYEDVLRLAEKKALLQMLAGLSTRHGVEPGFNGVEFHYVATITKPEALEMTRRLEAEIDDLQDRLNTYNASTRIELPRAVLDLAR
jgi:hypothetical protein